MSQIEVVQPVKSVLPVLQSASAHVISRVQQEVRPQSGTSFSYSGTKKIIFDVSSPSAMVDFSNSYLKFDLTISLSGADANQRYLAEGGANCLFRSIIIETASGTQISRIDRANQLNAVVKSLTYDNEYIESVLYREGDAVNPLVLGGFPSARQVAANTADYVICCQPFGAFLSDETLFPLAFVRSGIRITFELDEPHRVIAAGLTPTSTTNNSGENAEVKNPVMVLDYITPSTDLFEKYKDMFMSEGLKYPFMSFKTYNEQVSSDGLKVLNIHSGGRSARLFIGQIQDARAETKRTTAGDSGVSSYTVDSLAQGLQAGLTRFQLKSGSERFPLSSPLEVSSSCAEMSIQSERALNNLGRIHGKRGYAYQRQAFALANAPDSHEQGGDPTAGRAETMRYYQVIDLSRDSSHLSGLDLSLNNLQADYDFQNSYSMNNAITPFAAVASNRFISAWVGMDAILSISNRSVNVFS